MAVADNDTGKLLNYRQLMQSDKAQTSMGLVVSQWIRLIGTRHWRTDQGNRHDRVHIPKRGTNRADERCSLRTIRVHSATRKRRVQQNTIHSRRRQDQLSRCRGTPNSRNVGGQDALQQRHINQRSKILTMDIPWSVFLDYLGTNSFE